MKPFFIILTALSHCFSITPLMAEPLEVRTLSLDKSDIPDLYISTGKGHTLLPFSSVQPSELFIGEKSSPLALFKKAPDAEGKDQFKVAHQIKTPSAAKGIMLLAWTAEDQAKFLAIEDQFTAAKANEWLIINAGNKAIAFQVGAETKPELIQPNSVKTFNVSARSGTGAAILAKANIDQEVKTVYSTYWPIYSGQRLVVIITTQGKKVRVRPIFDRIPTNTKSE